MNVTIIGVGVATSVGDKFAGESVELPNHEAKLLIASGRAAVSDPDAPDEPDVTAPGVVDSRDPEPDSADPSPRKRR